MPTMDIPTLESTIASMVSEIGPGFGATAIWERATGEVYAQLKAPPGAPQLFNQLTEAIKGTLEGSGFPDIDGYFLIHLKGGNTIVMVKHDEDVLQGILVSSQVNLGTLFGFVIPAQVAGVKSARRY